VYRLPEPTNVAPTYVPPPYAPQPTYTIPYGAPVTAYTPVITQYPMPVSRFSPPSRVNYYPGPPYAGSPQARAMMNVVTPTGTYFAPTSTTVAPRVYSPTMSLYEPGPITYSP
jgi:hypothetical protein